MTKTPTPSKHTEKQNTQRSMFGGARGFRMAPRGPFRAQYRAYTPAFAAGSRDPSHIESGGKILLPASALAQLAQREVQYPMLFKLTGGAGHVTHVGVLEFTAVRGR